MKRMIKYMAVYAQRIILFFLIFMVAWWLYMSLVSGGFNAEAFKRSLGEMALFSLALGALVEMICTMGYIPLLINAQLSMGATRTEIAFGNMFGHGLIAVELTVLSVLIKLALPGVLQIGLGEYALLSFAVYVTVAGIGSLLGILVDRFGKVAYYIMVAVFALCGGVIGGASVAFMGSGLIEFSALNLMIVLSVVGILVFVVSGVIFKMSVRKKEVRV